MEFSKITSEKPAAAPESIPHTIGTSNVEISSIIATVLPHTSEEQQQMMKLMSSEVKLLGELEA